MAKKKIDTNRDELTGLLAESLNKKFSKTHHKVAYFLDGSEDSPTDVPDWVSTGSTVLDLAISNRPNGGFPVSKIVEITGLEQSGKSLLASHIIANTQKRDGVAIYIDTESSLISQFLQKILKSYSIGVLVLFHVNPFSNLEVPLLLFSFFIHPF